MLEKFIKHETENVPKQNTLVFCVHVTPERETSYLQLTFLYAEFVISPQRNKHKNVKGFLLLSPSTSSNRRIADCGVEGRVEILYIISFREPSECIAKTDIHTGVYSDTQW
jgi:hypothetical protein